MRDIQDAQASHRAGKSQFNDSLAPIREFFDSFFSPMRFVDVLIHTSPFQYIESLTLTTLALVKRKFSTRLFDFTNSTPEEQSSFSMKQTRIFIRTLSDAICRFCAISALEISCGLPP